MYNSDDKLKKQDYKVPPRQSLLGPFCVRGLGWLPVHRYAVFPLTKALRLCAGRLVGYVPIGEAVFSLTKPLRLFASEGLPRRCVALRAVSEGLPERCVAGCARVLPGLGPASGAVWPTEVHARATCVFAGGPHLSPCGVDTAVVACDEHAASACGKLVDECYDLVGCDDVEGACGFVEQEVGCTSLERGGEHDALAHAAGESANRFVVEPGHAATLLDTGDRRCLGPNGADGSHETADSHPGAQAWVVVACVCDASPVPCDVANVYAGNAGCALHTAHGVGA